MERKTYYFDYAATTPLDSRVLRAMSPYFSKDFGNPSNLYELGRRAERAIEAARGRMAKVLNCRSNEIIFTGSGTESDNLAILGVVEACKNFGNHIIASNIEHHAVLRPCQRLERKGFRVTLAEVDKKGIVPLDSIKKAICDKTILVSVMYASNEIGTIQPIKEIGEIIGRTRIRREGRGIKTPIFFHADACQAAGYLDLDVKRLGVDLLTFNGSKIYGPKGVGALIVKTGTKIIPVIFGGGQERGLRSGTENVAGIVGLAEALEIAQRRREKESLREERLRNYLLRGIIERIPKVILNGHPKKRLPNNINVSILDVEGEALLLHLDEAGIAVSTGSACDSESLEPSHVLTALDRPYEYIHGSLRFTLGRHTKRSDINYVLKVLPEIVEKLRKISPLNLKLNKKQKISLPKAFVGGQPPRFLRNSPSGGPHFLKKKG